MKRRPVDIILWSSYFYTQKKLKHGGGTNWNQSNYSTHFPRAGGPREVLQRAEAELRQNCSMAWNKSQEISRSGGQPARGNKQPAPARDGVRWARQGARPGTTVAAV